MRKRGVYIGVKSSLLTPFICYKSNGGGEAASPKLAFFSAFGSRPAVYGLPSDKGVMANRGLLS